MDMLKKMFKFTQKNSEKNVKKILEKNFAKFV